MAALNIEGSRRPTALREESILEQVRYAARSGRPEVIDQVKQEARERGRLQGLFAEVVLFNAER